ncbi:ABC transporter [Massilia sp. Root351]|jgi:lipopolysaccharide transport system permease protein|uniref:ABC transporter permease n=1 Tax=Massilia sp. Root351 TaxID=1736522 RepID=UPI000708A394|nr:ABC transporter permease [Massilia sp. Root351]KQV88701.1 ABC transporter [Massilia sp. Root351]
MISFAMFNAVWRYRGFVAGSIKREFQSKYRNSLLGAAWTVLNPLAMIVVYTVIFSQVMGSRLPGVATPFAYSIYLCAGVLTWGLFAEITSRSQSVFLEHANLIKKLQFPRLCLPLIVVLNALINFGIIFGLFVLFLAVSGNFPGWIFLAIVPVLLLQVLFAIGLGMILGVLNVFFRDVGQLFTIVLQFWFWFTPIVYPLSALPEPVRDLVGWNPMAGVISAYQTVLVNGQAPHWNSLLPITVLAVLSCALGLQLFRKRAAEMVDEL